MNNDSPGMGTYLIGGIVILVAAFAGISGLAWLFSIKGVDSGEICVVREGGPFDGRNVKEVRQPGSGPKPIGAFNKQDCLPVTERDLTEEVEQITVPSRDGVDIVVNGQALFRLTTAEDKAKDFYLKFGRRKWEGHDLSSEEGWRAFLKVRMIPILQDTLRQTIGTYDCIQLRNTCVYVLEADKLADEETGQEVQDKAKEVNNTQIIQEAQDDITKLFQQKLNEGLGGEFFEGVRFQNLKPDFTSSIADRVRAAQGKRAEVATTRLEAQRKKAEAQGQADAEFERGRGQRRANEERAKGLRAYARALRDPRVAKVEQIKALCGVDSEGQPKGCENLTVLGPNGFINGTSGR